MEFSHQPVLSQSNNELKQQGDGAGETSRTTNYELQGTGRATRAPVAQTLQSVRQTCSCTTATCLYRFARFPSCGIFTPTRAIPVKITSCNNRVTVPVTPQERQITSCRARGGQHARPSHKDFEACAKYAHAPPQRASTSLYDFHYELLHVLKLYIICTGMLLCTKVHTCTKKRANTVNTYSRGTVTGKALSHFFYSPSYLSN